MEPDKSFSDSPHQTALQEAELAALLRMLSISEGTFSLSIAICNNPALRKYLIGKIKEQKADIEIIPIEKDTSRVFTFVEKKINSKKPSAIFVTEIEKSLPSDDTQSKVIRTLNASRELWQDKFSCPVVFWLPEYAATMLQKDALDFASWISHTFEFVSEQATAVAGTMDAYAGNITFASNLDADKKRFRIAELEQRIEDAGDPPETHLAQHVLTWLNELAYIYKSIGDLDTAEKSILKSLHIAEKLDLQTTAASDYTNLGLIYQTRGDLDKAEQMLKKSLEIEKLLGRLEGMASACSSLGLIYRTRGDLDKAEQMHRKSLEINEKLGWSKGMASDYGNLGLISGTRGDIDKAEQMLKKSLEISEKLGLLEGVASAYGNLGIINGMRGDIDSAEQIFKKSLVIEEKIGRLNGIASGYANLGQIYLTRGDIEKAGEYWEKALEFYKKVGMKPETEKVQRWIDELKDK